QLDADRERLDADRERLDADREQLDAGRGRLDAGRGQLEADRGRPEAGRGHSQTGPAPPCPVAALCKEEARGSRRGRLPSVAEGAGRRRKGGKSAAVLDTWRSGRAV